MKHKIIVTVSEMEFATLCALANGSDVSPDEVLRQFIADLTHGPASRGSDERMLAQQYFTRTF